jgi:WD40 repeat protein
MSKQTTSSTASVGKILYLSFNQDLSCLSCGTDIGFIVFDTNPVKMRFQKTFNAGIGIVEAMYTCNILALVGGGDRPFQPPNKCILWDDDQSEIVSELEYREWVRGVKLTKDSLVVATDDAVRVYDLKNELNQLYKIKTGANPKGLVELSISPDHPLVLTKVKDVGNLAMVNYKKGQETEASIVECHKHAIQHIRLNKDATKFATTSELGTIVRVFDTQTQSQLNELRRGTEYATIQSVYFSDDSKFLLVCSDKQTIHIYSLCEQYTNTKSSLNLVSGFLPKIFGDEWSLAQITVPHNRYVAGITHRDDNCYDIYVFMYDGKYHHYKFNPEESDIVLLKEDDFITIVE